MSETKNKDKNKEQLIHGIENEEHSETKENSLPNYLYYMLNPDRVFLPPFTRPKSYSYYSNKNSYA